MVTGVQTCALPIFGGPSSAPAAAQPASGTSASNVLAATSVPATAARKVRGAKKAEAAARSLDPTLRYDWLKASEDTKYAGAGRNIFLAQAEPPPVPIGNGTTDHAKLEPPVPTGPPPPPPILLKFFGFSHRAGEPRKVFLSQDGDVFIAREGDIVDRRYKILRIAPNSVEVEDVLNNNRQSIPLTQG